MKPYKISLFLFVIIALLGLISYLFPSDGLQVGKVHLRFPNLEEFLAPTDSIPTNVPALSPEETLALQLAEMRSQEDARHRAFFESSAARIHFPNDSIALFDSLFAALDRAREEPMRVLHYGDSQIEEDRISNVLRDELQHQFGGSGVGYIPVMQTIPALSLKQSCNADLLRYMVYGNKSMRAPHNRYGLAGIYAELMGSANVSINGLRQDGFHNTASSFEKATFMVGNVFDSTQIVVSKAGTQTLQPSDKNIQLLEFNFAQKTSATNIYLDGYAEMYGILLDGERGVSLDNMPMRGCSGTIFTKMNAEVLSTIYRKKNVQLIILQYGGNIMPYMTQAKIEPFKQGMKRQINYLKRLAPQAQVLFIGPSDMSKRVNGKMQTYPVLPQVIQALKQAAHECNAAYWDLYSVMGGHNSMISWVNADPKLAVSDHVHFTRIGAKRVGEMLYKSLMTYYDYYKFRTSEQAEIIPSDSIQKAL